MRGSFKIMKHNDSRWLYTTENHIKHSQFLPIDPPKRHTGALTVTDVAFKELLCRFLNHHVSFAKKESKSSVHTTWIFPQVPPESGKWADGFDVQQATAFTRNRKAECKLWVSHSNTWCFLFLTQSKTSMFVLQLAFLYVWLLILKAMVVGSITLFITFQTAFYFH